MGAPHPGHGNVVEPVSSKGTPDDVQFVALSLIMDPQEHFAHALPFFMVACSITSFALVNSRLRWDGNQRTAQEFIDPKRSDCHQFRY